MLHGGRVWKAPLTFHLPVTGDTIDVLRSSKGARIFLRKRRVTAFDRIRHDGVERVKLEWGAGS